MSADQELQFPSTIARLATHLRDEYKLTEQQATSVIYALLEEGALREVTQERSFFDNQVALEVPMALLREYVVGTILSVTRRPGPSAGPTLKARVVATLPGSLQPPAKGRWTGMAEAFSDLIDGCNEHLRIASPYIDEGGLNYFMLPLGRLRNRGAKVSLLTRIDDLSQPSPWQLRALLNLHDLLGERCEMRSFSVALPKASEAAQILLAGLHAKLLLADSRKAYVGSGEVRNNALNRNFEAGLVIEEPEVAKALEALFDTVWAAAEFIGADYLRGFFSP